MKSLIGQFPTRAFVAWTEDVRVAKAKARLSRVVGRHRSKPPAPLTLSQPIFAVAVTAESEIRPLYDASVYLSDLTGDDPTDVD